MNILDLPTEVVIRLLRLIDGAYIARVSSVSLQRSRLDIYRTNVRSLV
jgi:hypothetical protein